MLTISIQPFAPRRLFVFVVAILCLGSAACLADPLFMNVRSTPYDRQMTPIQSALSAAPENSGEVNLELVNGWMQNLRAIPYSFSMEWKTPDEVENATGADCKGKAVALYRRMQSHGANRVRLVIGKRTAASTVTHTWVEWQTREGTYVLDPTINWMACRVDQLDQNAYVPLYAYDGANKYRAATAMLLAQN